MRAAATGKPRGRRTSRGEPARRRWSRTPPADGARVSVGVLGLLRLEALAAGDGEEEERAQDDEAGADGGGEEARADDGVVAVWGSDSAP